MTDNAFNTSYVWNTNTGSYHQLVVQSQKLINDALYNMWARADSDSALCQLTVEVSDVGSIDDGELNQPVIRLHVTSNSPQLYYLLTFSAGTLSLTYKDSSTGKTNTKTWDMTDWTFAFPVSIGTKTVKSGDADYQADISRMGLTAGDFTLAQLFIDMSQSTTLDSSLSSFGTEDWSTETSDVQNQFNAFVKGWLSQMASDSKTVIGVSLKAGDPKNVNQNAPSFPPTSCDYVTYPWLDPSSSSASSSDDSDGNALCLCLMTGHASPPSPPSLAYSGTFVNATDNNDGTFCMNSDQFWMQWLLPLTQTLNAGTQICPADPSVEAYAAGGFDVTFYYYLGYNPDHPSSSDTYYSFQQYAIENNEKMWEWDGDWLHTEAEDEVDFIVTLNKVVVDEYAESSSWVLYSPGSQKISIQGASYFAVAINQTGTSSGSGDTNASAYCYIQWHVNLVLGVVSDGGLQVKLDDSDTTDSCTATSGSDNDGLDLSSIAADMQSQFTTLLSEGLGSMKNNLQDALKNQHKLYLPASGVFLMRDAEFNCGGNLLASMSFNGADGPDDKAQQPEYLKHLPDREARHVVRAPPPKPQGPSASARYPLKDIKWSEGKHPGFDGVRAARGPPPMIFRGGQLVPNPARAGWPGAI